MSAPFYRAFEDRYRGTRELIKARLRAYADFLAPLAGPGPAPAALDLGCGRGEWLELLGEAGFAARGVDLDEGMLAACRERDLAVEAADALAALGALPDASLALVSAFHLAEHLPFETLRALAGEALRVLRPGGLLIMETPNPENLVVGACSFHLDPSHLKPLPPALLAFVVEHAGFARQRVLRLQEAPQLHTDAAIGLIDVLDGVSPDYAVVAQKGAPAAALAPFDAPFAAERGVTLAALAQRYDGQLARGEAALRDGLRELEGHTIANKLGVAALEAQLAQSGRERLEQARADQARLAAVEREAGRAEARLAQAELQTARAGLQAEQAGLRAERSALEATHTTLKAEQALGQAEQAAAQAGQAMLRAEQATAQAAQAMLQAEQAAQAAAQAARQAAQAEARAAQLAQRVTDLQASSSWRLTAPLRLAGTSLWRLRMAARQGRLGSGIKRRLLRLFPGLRAPLPAPPYPPPRAPEQPDQPDRAQVAPPAQPAAAPAELSPRAARMLRMLKKSLEARKN